jgi:ribosome-associated protein
MTKTIDQLKDFVITCLEDKKAENIIALDLGDKNPLAKYMIFASGKSTKNVAGIADYLSLEIKHKTDHTAKVEGLSNSEWVLVDLGDIIIHIFHPETRERFKLEDMWSKK